MRRQQLFTALAAAAFMAGTVGCTSATNVRFGQLTTGGHVKVTEKPRLAVEKADDGFGFKLALGWVELGATTTHDPEAKHLALGIDSSTGFDGKEDTLVTSASRLGAGPVNIGGDLAFGLERITLKGVAKIDAGCPQAIYGDHWTGPTAKYVPFPEVAPADSPDAIRLSKNLLLGPLSAAAAFDMHGCRAAGCTLGPEGPPWHGSGTFGPFTQSGDADWGECSQAFGCGFFLGLTDIAGDTPVPQPAPADHEMHDTGIDSHVSD